MKASEIPLLGYALLGLLNESPLSGYGVRKIFTETPMGSFSNSPGVIYPALERLEKAALIRGRVEDSSGLRRRKIFQLTKSGIKAFKDWLKRPVTQNDVIHGPDELMLRFSFMDNAIGEVSTLRFLKSMNKELAVFATSLREFLNSNQAQLPRSGALALESGVRRYEALLAWSEHAITVYEETEK
ncbi:MAG TPA: PadR family transcriptional regulator [Terriglobales bacterium]|nr:PadR family transcriptional regulator [Terriglobales bacterium]